MNSTRKLQPGAQVETKYSGRWTRHEIVDRREVGCGVAFKVTPYVPRTTGGWIGADAFRPAGKRMGWKAKAGLALAGALVVAAFYFGLPQALFDLLVLEITDCNTSSLAKSC